jgi:hypothetical protein
VQPTTDHKGGTANKGTHGTASPRGHRKKRRRRGHGGRYNSGRQRRKRLLLLQRAGGGEVAVTYNRYKQLADRYDRAAAKEAAVADSR